MQFTELGLSAGILRAVGEQGYDTPTPIQREAIPHILAGRDLEAMAQTGTGKTAAFVLPILHRLTHHEDSPLERVSQVAPRVLILVPTRELAAQVLESVRTYGKHTRLRSLAVFGGVGMQPQVQALRRGIDILVATPGRLLDHLGQRTANLSHVQTLVLDEADRRLDMGFIRDIRKIIERLPAKRQNLMFSATFADEVRELAHGILRNPALVEVARRNAPIELVSQSVIRVDKEKKRDALLHLFDTHGWHQTLVFTRTKHGADALARKLEQAGVRSAAIHGDKTQGARTKALADFKAGKLAALVATDIAARGIDIDLLPRVVNYELPNVPEDYVHRIGRTGRAGAEGEALSLVCADERIQLRDIERLIKRDLDKRVLPGFEPQQAAPAPAAERRAQPKATPRKPAPRSGKPSGGPEGRRPGQAGKAGGGVHHSGLRHR
ncbi:MAG: DEAD/DEAH box helicase [Rhodocyclaceae bacterium]|nr:DEAD/DEAH box helicase [Rhodocyclaceae bacterium]